MRYQILETLAERDAVKTELALDTQTHQKVVIKTLAVSRSDDESLRLFERETQTLRNISHPCIPKLVDFAKEEGRQEVELKLVQSYVEGRTLQALIESGKRFTEREALHIAKKLAEVLLYLHELYPPIVHRDLKSSNVILDDNWGVHVVDFGAVTAPKAEGNTVVGTFGYMPPEQFEGRATPASDVYALGVLLCTLLTHKEPWKHQGGPRRALEQLNVQQSFKHALLAFTQSDENQRPRNGRAALAALNANFDTPRVIVDDAATLKQKSNVGVAMALMMVGAFVLLGVMGALAFYLTSAPVVIDKPTADHSPKPVVPKKASKVKERAVYKAISCVRSSATVSESRARYLAWAKRKGITCRERYISYSLYETHVPSSCDEFKDTSVGAEHKKLSELLAEMHAFNESAAPKVKKAALYFEDGYQDDKCAFGKSNHRPLLALLDRGDELSRRSVVALDEFLATRSTYEGWLLADLFYSAGLFIKNTPYELSEYKTKRSAFLKSYEDFKRAFENAQKEHPGAKDLDDFESWIRKLNPQMRKLQKRNAKAFFGRTHDPYHLRFGQFYDLVSSCESDRFFDSLRSR